MAAFRLLGIEDVRLNVRNRDKGEELLERFRFAGRVGAVDDRDNLVAAQLIVNASVLGMAGQAEMPETVLAGIEGCSNDATIVFDMVYAPLETELLRAADRRGLRIVDGLRMLVAQAGSAFEAFYGSAPPREHDDELRRLLTS
jgi:shikimate dehydrogenase